VPLALRGDRLAERRDAKAGRVLVDASAMAFSAVLSIAGGPSSSGNPWPRFTAPIRAASADISAKIVTA
jgi:hypothetical protein